MSLSEFILSILSGGILIVFRCWFESKWKRNDRHQKDDQRDK